MHFGTIESAEKRIEVKIREDERLGGYGLKDKKNNPIIMEVDLDYSKSINLKENRSGAWTPFDVLRAVMEKAENGEIKEIKEITEKEINDYYCDELSHNGILLVDLCDEEDYDGAFNNELKEHYFIRNWLEDKGYDSIIYENDFEGGGDSIIIFRKNQISIKNKDYLNNKIEAPKKPKSKKLHL